MNPRLIRRTTLGAAVLLLVALAGPATATVVRGTDGPDVLTGTAVDDTLRGFAGNDTIYALAGPDLLNGGAHADDLYAGLGNDTVYGMRGYDTLRGRGGDDRLFPGDDESTDILIGGPGNDVIVARTGEGVGRDFVYAGDGDDHVTVAEVSGWYVPVIDCGPGKDTLLLPYGLGMSGAGCERVVSAPSPYD